MKVALVHGRNPRTHLGRKKRPFCGVHQVAPGPQHSHTAFPRGRRCTGRLEGRARNKRNRLLFMGGETEVDVNTCSDVRTGSKHVTSPEQEGSHNNAKLGAREGRRRGRWGQPGARGLPAAPAHEAKGTKRCRVWMPRAAVPGQAPTGPLPPPQWQGLGSQR